jgi:serine/threonine protein kinase
MYGTTVEVAMRPSGLTDRFAQFLQRRSARIEAPEDRALGQVVLGKYTIAGYLGEGSNARVYVASNADNPAAPVVVKLVKEHVAANPRFRQFFDAEVRSMARFNHPYAVRLFDASLDEPLGPCLVLDYIPGLTLENLLARNRRLPAERVARLLGPLCHALQAAHDAGIVHRDLKPANLMVVKAGTPEESVRVMDFGFAGFTAKPHIQLAELTGKGQMWACGTPAYVSPEMVRGDAVDSRADLYSVGVMLYEMLTGRLPFDKNSSEQMVAAHVREEPPRFKKIGSSDVPRAVEDVVRLALSKYPNERQQTARDLALQFGRAVGFDVWEATAPTGYVPPSKAPDDEIVECTLAEGPPPPSPADPFVLTDRFEAMMPDRLAAVKLRGFIEDVGGEAVASEPGLIRVRVGMPARYREPVEKPQGSRLLSWFATTRVPSVNRGEEPIEIDLQMERVDANRVKVVVTFRPLKEYVPDNLGHWQERCEGIYTMLRRYLMAS